MQPTPGTLADLQHEADPEQVARLIVLRALSAAPKTRAQLSQLLAKRGVVEDVAGAVLDSFESMGYVDDAVFANEWVQQRHRAKGLSRRALAHELQQRGVDVDAMEPALATIDDEAERERAQTLARAKAPALTHLPLAVASRRLAGYLARRGYGSAVISVTVRSVLADQSGFDEAPIDH